MSLAWPLTVALGLVLAFIVAWRALGRSEAKYITRADLGAVHAHVAALTDSVAKLQDEVVKTQARIPAQPGDRSIPLGLRRGP